MHMKPPVDQRNFEDPNEPKVLRLQAAARALTSDAVCAERAHFDVELVSLVDECLLACRDGVLLHALDRLRDEHEAHALLRTQIETASASAFFDTPEGGRVVRLCAIPVLFSNEQPLENGDLVRGAAFDALSASIRQTGLIHAGATITLAEYLYHPTELDSLWPSEVCRLPASLMLRAQEAGGIPKGLAALGRSGWPRDAAAGTPKGVQLRYLLAAVSEELGAGDAIRPRSDDEKERLQVALCNWAAHASSPLAAALGLSADEVVVLSFGPYAQAVRTGFDSLRYVQLRGALAPLVDFKIRARSLSVTLELCGYDGGQCGVGDATAIRLLATSSLRDDCSSKDGRSLEHHYPITSWADAKESMERVVNVLRDASVRRIWVVKRSQEARRFPVQNFGPEVIATGASLSARVRADGVHLLAA